jgi:hypothetical protein
MDGHQFDDLLRAALTSRRSLLGRALAAGGVLTGYELSEAKKKKKKKPCSPCKKRKKGKCKANLPDGTVCSGGNCLGGVCMPCGAGGDCLVFLTSATYQGDLGGLPGADAKCQGLAQDAGLPGSYRAWLSDATSAPVSRFVRSPGPYKLLNGVAIARNWDDLTDGSPLEATITVTETGGGPGDSLIAWTATQPNGTFTFGTAHCNNWSTNGNGPTGNFGAVDRLDTWSTVPVELVCVNRMHLYCFQQR